MAAFQSLFFFRGCREYYSWGIVALSLDCSRDEFEWNTAQVWRELDWAFRLEQRNSKAWVYVVATFIFIDVRHVMPGKKQICLFRPEVHRLISDSDSFLFTCYMLGTWSSTRVNSTESNAAATKPTVTGRGRTVWLNYAWRREFMRSTFHLVWARNEWEEQNNNPKKTPMKK